MVVLDIATRLDMLDLVQTVLTHLAGQIGFDDESCHYMTVAVRESVVNAIKHGNGMDESKRVYVRFEVGDDSIGVEVEDQGEGFQPEEVLDPLAPENLLKATGRGIFFMRSFMDEVDHEFPARGGTIVRMKKSLPQPSQEDAASGS
jgi:serine/threonine-protein kinase RsbW